MLAMKTQRKRKEFDDSWEHKPSLLAKAARSKADELSPMEQMLQQEREMIADVSETKKLVPVHELAKGITYTEPLWTGWKPPSDIRRMSKKQCDHIREQQRIVIVNGVDVLPPVTSFEGMRLIEPVLRKLKEKGIVQPTPMQVQGLPIVLSGRDMIGIAFTGSGKTFVFVLPLVMVCLQEELVMPIVRGEGPFGLIICPSRELGTQTYEVIQQFFDPFREAGYPKLRPLLCIGGVDMRSQEVVKKGVHIVVVTPRRLKDMLTKEDES